MLVAEMHPYRVRSTALSRSNNAAKVEPVMFKVVVLAGPLRTKARTDSLMATTAAAAVHAVRHMRAAAAAVESGLAVRARRTACATSACESRPSGGAVSAIRIKPATLISMSMPPLEPCSFQYPTGCPDGQAGCNFLAQRFLCFASILCPAALIMPACSWSQYAPCAQRTDRSQCRSLDASRLPTACLPLGPDGRRNVRCVPRMQYLCRP